MKKRRKKKVELEEARRIGKECANSLIAEIETYKGKNPGEKLINWYKDRVKHGVNLL